MPLLRAWPALLFGWGPIALAFAGSAVGILTQSAGWLFVSAAVAAVPTGLAAGTPGKAWTLGFPVLLLFAAWLMRRQRTGYATLVVAACALAGGGLMIAALL